MTGSRRRSGSRSRGGSRSRRRSGSRSRGGSRRRSGSRSSTFPMDGEIKRQRPTHASTVLSGGLVLYIKVYQRPPAQNGAVTGARAGAGAQ